MDRNCVPTQSLTQLIWCPRNQSLRFRTLPKARFPGLHFCRWNMDLASLNLMQLAPRAAVLCEKTCCDSRWAVQGHSKSPISVQIKSLCATSCQWIILTHVLSRTVSDYHGTLVKLSLFTGDAIIWSEPRNCRLWNFATKSYKNITLSCSAQHISNHNELFRCKSPARQTPVKMSTSRCRWRMTQRSRRADCETSESTWQRGDSVKSSAELYNAAGRSQDKVVPANQTSPWLTHDAGQSSLMATTHTHNTAYRTSAPTYHVTNASTRNCHLRRLYVLFCVLLFVLFFVYAWRLFLTATSFLVNKDEYIDQVVWGTDVCQWGPGQSLSTGSGTKSPRSWSSLQTLFIDSDCNNDQTLKILHSSFPDS